MPVISATQEAEVTGYQSRLPCAKQERPYLKKAETKRRRVQTPVLPKKLF
jgi:hypothetical protein